MSRSAGRYVRLVSRFRQAFLAMPAAALLSVAAWGQAAPPATPPPGTAAPAQSGNPAASPSPVPSPAAGQQQSPDAQSAQPAPEIKTQEAPVPLRVRINLVPMRVVVRDAQGHAVPNLRREDFEVKEGRTVQAISTFSVDTLPPATAKAPAADAATANGGGSEATKPASFLPPARFTALLFDDVHVKIGDLQRVKLAANRYLDSSMKATDRMAVVTFSGVSQLDFTDDRDKLHDTIDHLLPRSVTASSSTGSGDCPSVNYYQASQIVNFNDDQAFNVTVQDALICAFQGDPTYIQQATALARSTAFRILSAGDTETQYSFRRISEIVRRMAGLPGQRSIVLVSPGFLYTRQEYLLSDLLDFASRNNVIVNSLDARGLYTVEPFGDISEQPNGDPRLTGFHDQYQIEGERRNSDVLMDLANGTGGIAFSNSNDLDVGFQQVAATPEVSYLLGISPTNLKFNGQFHQLKVTVQGKEKYLIQARKGYYAPKKSETEEDVAKRDIEDAVFSQEQVPSFPIEVHTQYYKVDPADAKLTVLSHVDVRHLHFEKADGRNKNNLTVVTVLFDRNGNYVTGSQKVVELRLLDTTLDRLKGSGMTLRTSFDVKPGAYVVRLVVRDSNAALLASQNGTVEIPY